MIFIEKAQAARMQKANIDEFGGSHGLRDDGAFESALAAAENRFLYEDADAITCAATYGFHLCQAHAFVDGNKRIAAAVAISCLRLNGHEFTGTNEEIIQTFLKLASSEMSRDELEAFLRSRTQKLP